MIKQFDFQFEKQLAAKAGELRIRALDMVYRAQSGHLGGAFSAAEILTVLYFYEMRLDHKAPRAEERDRFVLSKGHITPAYYAVLAMRGFFPMAELRGFRKFGSILQGHPDRKHIPGVDMSSGSLGQGVSAAVGMAIAGKLKGADFRVYTLLGDGEIQEGQVWEAFMLAAHRKLNNLCAFIDNNDLQCDGHIGDVNSPYPIDAKLRAFGWNAVCIDGHDIHQLLTALDAARNCVDRPTAIIAKTVKGKGVSFMENQAGWHGKAPNADEYRTAMRELLSNPDIHPAVREEFEEAIRCAK